MNYLFLFLPGVFLLVNAAAGPAIQVNSGRIEFGKFAANQAQQSSVTVSNTGDEILIIDKIRTTCGCMEAVAAKTRLAPGESTILTAGIEREGVSGPFSNAIYIQSNASNQKMAMISLNGEAVPLAVVLPKDKLFLGTLTAGEEFRQEFLVKFNQKNVELMAPIGTGDLPVKLEFSPMDDHTYRLVMSFTPDQPMESFAYSVAIGILAPQDWSPVQIRVQGKVKSSQP